MASIRWVGVSRRNLYWQAMFDTAVQDKVNSDFFDWAFGKKPEVANEGWRPGSEQG